MFIGEPSVITAKLDRVALRPGARILDIGCGTGRHTCAAYKKDAAVAIGADIKFEEVREAKNRLELHERLGVHGSGAWGVCVADTLCLPFAKATFDLVVCCEVLEHIRKHKVAVTELARVLKPGHQLVVSVPRYWPEKICWTLSTAYSRESGGHVRIYRKTGIIDLLYNAGFRLCFTHYAHSLHTPYWWLKCLVGHKRDDHRLVNRYHQFLTWDIMQQPRITEIIDRLFNPVLGKSIVLYFKKTAGVTND